MAHHFSFNTEVVPGEQCYYFSNDIEGWKLAACISCEAYIYSSNSIKLIYRVERNGQLIPIPCVSDTIVNKVAFDEWRSRVIDTAVQQFKFKGNPDNVFGPPSFNQLLPMYAAGKSPVTAYMASMGLLETEFDND